MRRRFSRKLHAGGSVCAGALAVAMFTIVCTGCATKHEAPTLRVTRVYVVAPAGDAPAVMYLSMTNETPAADTLTKVVTPAAASAELHRDRGEAMSHDMAGMQGAMGAGHEMAMMVPVALVPIPAGETIRFAPGGYHVMLMHPSVPARGTTVPVTLHFARAGNIQANATVITYADVDSATRPSHDHSSK